MKFNNIQTGQNTKKKKNADYLSFGVKCRLGPCLAVSSLLWLHHCRAELEEKMWLQVHLLSPMSKFKLVEALDLVSPSWFLVLSSELLKTL